MPAIINLIQSILPSWKVCAFILPIVLQATVLRKRGGYYYRIIVSICVMCTFFVYLFALLVIARVLRIDKSIATANGTAFYRMLVRTFLALDVEIEDAENYLPQNQPAIYIFNHQTMIDLVIMAFTWPSHSSVIVKKSLKYYPMIGWFFIMNDTVFLDRKNNTNAVAQFKKMGEELNSRKLSVSGFPEGTRSGGHTTDLLPFKKGFFYMAAQAKVPIVPIVIENQRVIFDSKKKYFGYGTIKVKVLPPIITTNIAEDSVSVGKLANDTRDLMLTALEEMSTFKGKED